MSTALIRGIGIPFSRPRWVGDAVEMVDPAAFTAALANGDRRVPVLLFSHDEGSAANIGSATVFAAAEIGLLFEVEVDETDANARTALRMSVTGTAQSSIGFAKPFVSAWRMESGLMTRVITEAEVGHICLCADAAYGSLAPAWRADAAACLNLAPWRTQDLDERFRRAKAQQSRSSKHLKASRVPAAVPRALRLRQAGFAATRAAVFQAMARGDVSNNPILMHAAFSKAGGYSDEAMP